MITQRVAENFWFHRQPYFNEGEAVAANTSLFWPIFLSPLYAVASHKTAVPLLIVLSTAMSAAAVVIASTLTRDRLLQAAGAVLLSASPPLLAYGGSGWEHVPQSLLLTLAFVLIAGRSQREQRLSVPFPGLALASASFLFRPDSAPAIAMLGVAWLFLDDRFRRPSGWIAAAPLLLIPAVYLLLMEHFYGQPYPNTALLKIAGLSESLELGVRHVVDPRQAGLVPLLTAGLALLRPKGAFARLLLGLSALQILYVLLVGGDIFPHGRFFLILLPVLAFAVLEELRARLAHRPDGGPTLAMLAFATVVLWSASDGVRAALKRDAHPEFSHIAEHIRIADVLGCALTPEDGSIGLHYLGIAYHLPGFHVVDFLGKAEPHIAATGRKFGPVGHNKWDYDYAFAAYRIAAVPMSEATVARVRTPGFAFGNYDMMFWDVAAFTIERDGRYEFLPPATFGNRYFGAYVRSGLAGRVSGAACR